MSNSPNDIDDDVSSNAFLPSFSEEILRSPGILRLFYFPPDVYVPDTACEEGFREVGDYATVIASALEKGIQKRDELEEGVEAPFYYMNSMGQDLVVYKFIKSNGDEGDASFSLTIVEQGSGYLLTITDVGVLGSFVVRPKFNENEFLGDAIWRVPEGSYIQSSDGWKFKLEGMVEAEKDIVVNINESLV